MVKTYLRFFLLIVILEMNFVTTLYSQITPLHWKIYEDIFLEKVEETTSKKPKEDHLNNKESQEIILPKNKEENILLQDYYQEDRKKDLGEEKEEEIDEKEIIYVEPPYSQGKVIKDEVVDKKRDLIPPEYPEYIYHPKRVREPLSWREIPLEKRLKFLDYLAERYTPSIGVGIEYAFFSPQEVKNSLGRWANNIYSYFSKNYSEDLSDKEKEDIFVIPKDTEGKEIIERAVNKYQGLTKERVIRPLGSAFYNLNLSFQVKPNFFLGLGLGNISYLSSAMVNYSQIKDERDNKLTDDPDDTEIYTMYSGDFAFKYSIEANAFPLRINGFLKYPYLKFKDTHLYTGIGLLIIPTILKVNSGTTKDQEEVYSEAKLKFFKVGYGVLFFQGFKLDITDWLGLEGVVDYKIASAKNFKDDQGNYEANKIWYFKPSSFGMDFTGFGFNLSLNMAF
ncbi:MAG: hypothetical protein ABIG09_01025 [bacterium]